MNSKSIAAFALGPIGGAVLGLVTLPVITWFFSTGDIGRIAMLQVTMSFGVLLFGLGLDQAYVREYHEVEDRPALLKAALLPGAMVTAVVLGALLLPPGLISRLLFGINSVPLSLLVALCLLAAFLARFLSLILRMQERGVAFSMSQILPRALFLAIIGIYVLFRFGFDLMHLVLAHTVSVLAVCLIYSWNTRREWLPAMRRRIDPDQLRAMLRFGLPLILGGLAFWGLTATDKVFLRALSSFEQLGIYSVAVSFAGAAIIVQNVFSTVWAPTVYKWVSKGEDLDKVQLVIRYILIILLLLFSLAGTFSWLLDYVLPPAYSDVKYILVSCLGYPLLYTLSEATKVGIGISRKSLYSMVVSVIAFALNALGNILLIPLFGAAGAAVSTGVAFWVFFVLRTECSIRLWVSIPRFELYTFTFIALGLASLTTLYGEEMGFVIHLVWALVLVLVLARYADQLTHAMAWLLAQRNARNTQ